MPKFQEHVQRLSIEHLRTHIGDVVHTLQTDEEVSEPLRSVGWTPAMTASLAGQLETLTERIRSYRGLKSEKKQAAAAFDASADTFRRGLFRRHVLQADAIFHDDRSARATLGIEAELNSLRTSFDRWAPQADDFYTHLTTDPELLDVVRQYDGLLESLQAGHERLGTIRAQKQTRDNLDDDRQQARRDRDAARDALITAFRRMQKFALAGLFGTEALGKVGYVFASDEASDDDLSAT